MTPRQSWEVERWEARRATRAFGCLLVLMGAVIALLVLILLVLLAHPERVEARPAPRGPGGQTPVERWSPVHHGPAPIVRAPVTRIPGPWL